MFAMINDEPKIDSMAKGGKTNVSESGKNLDGRRCILDLQWRNMR